MADQLEILPFDPQNAADDDLADFIELSYHDFEERRGKLPPIPRTLIRRILLTEPPAYWKYHRYVAYLTGKMIGMSFWTENVDTTNLNIASVYVFITKTYRKKGFGSRLLRFTIDQLRDSIDTITITVITQQHTSKSKYSDLQETLQTLGGKLALTDVVNAADISHKDPTEVENRALQLKDDAHQKGFDIVLIRDGRVKDSTYFQLQEYLDMREKIWNDMPSDDLSREDEHLTEEESDEMYRVLRDEGFQIYTYYVIDRATKKPIGLTEIHFNPEEPEMVFQDDTGVLQAYRGNNLGMTLKYQSLALLRTDPRFQNVRCWVTGNAGSNEHMLRINKLLGYEPVNYRQVYEFEKAELHQKLQS